MFCTSCGKEISNTAKFCTGCGAPVNNEDFKPELAEPLKEENIQDTKPIPLVENKIEEEPYRYTEPTVISSNSDSQNNTANKTKIIIIVAIIVIAALAAVIVFLLLSKNNNDNRANEGYSDINPTVDHQEENRYETEEFEDATRETESLEVEVEEDLVNQAGTAEYILPDSDTRVLTERDLEGLTKDQLRIARNEIYARKGRKFKDAELQAYFEGLSWYNGIIEADRFSDGMLSAVENANKDLIVEYEIKIGAR